MTEIVDIRAIEILDSRGNPTVEVEVALMDGSVGEKIKIPRQFPKKISVRAGTAYFMYKQDLKDDTNRLYRMPL